MLGDSECCNRVKDLPKLFCSRTVVLVLTLIDCANNVSKANYNTDNIDIVRPSGTH